MRARARWGAGVYWDLLLFSAACDDQSGRARGGEYRMSIQLRRRPIDRSHSQNCSFKKVRNSNTEPARHIRALTVGETGERAPEKTIEAQC